MTKARYFILTVVFVGICVPLFEKGIQKMDVDPQQVYVEFWNIMKKNYIDSSNSNIIFYEVENNFRPFSGTYVEL